MLVEFCREEISPAFSALHPCLMCLSVAVEFKEPIKDVRAAAKALKNTVGVVDHGLFVDMTYR